MHGGMWRLGEQVRRCSEGLCEISTVATALILDIQEATLWFLLLAREPSQARCPTLGSEAKAGAQEQRGEQQSMSCDVPLTASERQK